jgi:hypothetical protein
VHALPSSQIVPSDWPVQSVSIAASEAGSTFREAAIAATIATAAAIVRDRPEFLLDGYVIVTAPAPKPA